jgi:hypothetical protein
MTHRLVLPAPVEKAPEHFGPQGTLQGSRQHNEAADKSHKNMKNAPVLEATNDRRNRSRDIEALHHVQASRPLKPPVYHFGPRLTRVAMLAVREDRKAGVLV